MSTEPSQVPSGLHLVDPAEPSATRETSNASEFTPHPNITGRKSHYNPFSVEAMPTQEDKKARMIRVYDAYVAAGPEGGTREEIYKPLGIITQSGHPICSELIRNGKLIRTGKKGTSALGKPAEILIADVYAVSERKPPQSVQEAEPTATEQHGS